MHHHRRPPFGLNGAVDSHGPCGEQVYTGPPILILGLLDQDVSAEDAQEFPLLYKDGPEGKRFNVRIFWYGVIRTATFALPARSRSLAPPGAGSGKLSSSRWCA